MPWSRGRMTYGGSKTTNEECVWFSPGCLKPEMKSHQFSFFDQFDANQIGEVAE